MSAAPAQARAEDLVVHRSGAARFLGRRFVCAVGRGGFVCEKREGDGAAPFGVFALEGGYHRPDRIPAPRTPLPMRPLRLWDGWSDDPADPLYNRPVRQPHAFGHERLWRADPRYDLIVVFSANRRPIRPSGGSALFLHLWLRPRYPTAGCVAFARQDLLWILARWRRSGRLILAG